MTEWEIYVPGKTSFVSLFADVKKFRGYQDTFLKSTFLCPGKGSFIQSIKVLLHTALSTPMSFLTYLAPANFFSIIGKFPNWKTSRIFHKLSLNCGTADRGRLACVTSVMENLFHVSFAMPGSRGGRTGGTRGGKSPSHIWIYEKQGKKIC